MCRKGDLIVVQICEAAGMQVTLNNTPLRAIKKNTNLFLDGNTWMKVESSSIMFLIVHPYYHHLLQWNIDKPFTLGFWTWRPPCRVKQIINKQKDQSRRAGQRKPSSRPWDRKQGQQEWRGGDFLLNWMITDRCLLQGARTWARDTQGFLKEFPG